MFKRYKVKRALNKLVEECDPYDSSKIAKRLEELGIRGEKHDGYVCPLAVYIKKQTGLSVHVSRWHVTDGFRDIRLDHSLTSFINSFDVGLYPNLISVEDSTGREEIKDV